MSAVLKGLLQPAIQGVLTSFGTDATGYIGPPNQLAADAMFADRLSTAIAIAVQTYLNTSVTTVPMPSGTTVGFGPVGHTHPTVPHKLLAP